MLPGPAKEEEEKYSWTSTKLEYVRLKKRLRCLWDIQVKVIERGLE